MGRRATKAQGNVWYAARIEASKRNERLSSRFGAAEEMGLAEDAIKSAELGLYKAMPVENAVLMADCYGAPELRNYYCLHECPIGCAQTMSADLVDISEATVKILARLRPETLDLVRSKLLDIAEDGTVTDDEVQDLTEVIDILSSLCKSVSELRTIGERVGRGSTENSARNASR